VKIKVVTISAGPSCPQPRCSPLADRFQAEPLKTNAIPSASMIWLGLVRASLPPSMPNRVCQIISPTPPNPNSTTPSSESQ